MPDLAPADADAADQALPNRLPVVDSAAEAKSTGDGCDSNGSTTTTQAKGSTEVGSYFVSNYPPFSQWTKEAVPAALDALNGKPPSGAIDPSIPLGLYIHIPFCRKRCKFCYFRVYTQQNAKTVRGYVDSLEAEFAKLENTPGVQGRELEFAYFGGGTPSYLSSKQLRSMRDKLQTHLNWETAREVTFECEPGTLNEEKVQTLKEIGVTRLSLGIENFDDTILEVNGRAHLTPEVYQAWEWIKAADFPQVNIDLIAGMIGETDENWQRNLEEAAKLEPDNVTVYQMELPHNTIISKEIKELGVDSPIADWDTKRRWMDETIDFLAGYGYVPSSGNEFVKSRENDRFVYRDSLWRGADLLATGVSSFGHFQGVHYQNLDKIDDYQAAVAAGDWPINRALVPSKHQQLIREFVLQLKEGRVHVRPFREKFGVDLREEFAEPLKNQTAAGYLNVEGDEIVLTRKGLLQTDSLLPEYFEEQFKRVRYT
ncbi:coproporphyrinogen-III oxidase family protein [Alienimonas californiensis]|uniref:Oxygen-independent coproporphyrinogen-III oxidase 1 n=1 Tax=Alienimonas californiensis TaxID=2527989 RepID=A0A517P7R6_9PLAN|nr:coproporphyrinogen-III oxidase family protein [Alienimonas californiensis]QDT15402.1 Oxygen-independent coproporphyrinogen-III oxidase 1 [Alienimonas californiensis]